MGTPRLSVPPHARTCPLGRYSIAEFCASSSNSFSSCRLSNRDSDVVRKHVMASITRLLCALSLTAAAACGAGSPAPQAGAWPQDASVPADGGAPSLDRRRRRRGRSGRRRGGDRRGWSRRLGRRRIDRGAAHGHALPRSRRPPRKRGRPGVVPRQHPVHRAPRSADPGRLLLPLGGLQRAPRLYGPRVRIPLERIPHPGELRRAVRGSRRRGRSPDHRGGDGSARRSTPKTTSNTG